ncbi:hypothetical protein [Dactylosporangium sp. CA-233914]|uniref:hypothetical protein n=1 Tax=Dactylosporangium sp. CA-233914 TaxID=3239934 RepID=UPI003D8E8385
MSFAAPAPAPRARPTTVTLAAFALFGAAAIEVISVVIALLYAGKIAENTKRLYEEAGLSTSSNAGLGIGSSVGALFGFIFIVILVVLGYLVSRGNQVGRVLTWVLGGLLLCCSVVGLGGTLFAKTFWEAGRKSNSRLPDWDRYQDVVYSGIPGWYQPVTTVLSVLLVIAILLSIILLALPSSHPYFRKEPQQWEPPLPGQPGF